MRLATAAAVLALAALPAAATPGFFTRDTGEPKETPAPDVIVGATCSLMASYDPDRHGVEHRFLGDFAHCGGLQGFYAAASAAAATLHSSATFAREKAGAPSFGWPFQCSIHVDFESATPSTVRLVFTGAAACTEQRAYALAAVKESLTCDIANARCPLAR